MDINNILDDFDKLYENLTGWRPGEDENATELKQYLTTAITNALEATRLEHRYQEPMFTTQAFTSFTCKSCNKDYSWHNGAPPKLCDTCSKDTREKRISRTRFKRTISKNMELL